MRTSESAGKASVTVDAGHARLERRINSHAEEYAVARLSEDEEARALSLRYSILNDSMRFFPNYDSGLGGRRDDAFNEVLVDTLMWCLERHDPQRSPFTNFVRFKFKRKTISWNKKAAEKAERDATRRIEIDSLGEGSLMQYGIYSEDSQQFEEKPVTSGDQVTAAVIEFISLVIEFLEHSLDRAHSERAKLYMRMNFTEWTTYSVKAQPTLWHCEPWMSDQTRIFATIENGFLNVYMSAPCASIHELWDTALREGYGEIIRLDDPRLQTSRPPAPWKLATSVHLDYLYSLGIKVTPGAVSQHRSKFNALKKELTTFSN